VHLVDLEGAEQDGLVRDLDGGEVGGASQDDPLALDTEDEGERWPEC